MQEINGLQLAFLPREEQLEPCAAVASGSAARALAERVLRAHDDQLRTWSGVAADGLFIVLGDNDSLPWVEGIRYLGRDPSAPRLLLPTNLRPALVALEVFERALFSHAPRLGAPLAVLLDPPRVVSVSDALPIRRDRVSAWLEANS
ncbi:MAG TPA: hypothetical protein VFQ61_18920 [Polyangiaceae bacterium]|nr:hypothetical protein [Polyangiaceae bacterium]